MDRKVISLVRNSVRKQSGHRGVRSNSRQKGENLTVRRKGTQNQIEEGVADAEKKKTSGHSVTFLCAVSNTSDETPKCVAEVLGENIPFLIHSGTVANIVSKKMYDMIKDKVVLEKISKTLYAFGQSDRLNMKGQFHAVVKVQDKAVNALFFVYDGDNAISNLMSAKTARDLSLLHVQAAVSKQNLEGVIKSKYLKCFKGVGKLKGCNITLHVDPQCEPVAQPVRRVPFAYKEKITRLFERLVLYIDNITLLNASWSTLTNLWKSLALLVNQSILWAISM